MKTNNETNIQKIRSQMILHISNKLQSLQNKKQVLSNSLHHGSHEYYEQLAQKQKDSLQLMVGLQQELQKQNKAEKKQELIKYKLHKQIEQYQTRLRQTENRQIQVMAKYEEKDIEKKRMRDILRQQLELKRQAGENRMKLDYLRTKLKNLQAELEQQDRQINEIREQLHRQTLGQCIKIVNEKKGNTISTLCGSHESQKKDVQSAIYLSTQQQLITLNQFNIE